MRLWLAAGAMMANEQQWLKHPSLSHLASMRQPIRSRKFRLLGCAICRLYWDRVKDVRSRLAVETTPDDDKIIGFVQGLPRAVDEPRTIKACRPATINSKKDLLSGPDEALHPKFSQALVMRIPKVCEVPKRRISWPVLLCNYSAITIDDGIP